MKSIFKKLTSYIWPIKEVIKSELDHQLEVTWENGKKVLNTKNANYSYGSLQKILEKGLENIDLTKINSILLLGLGAGSIIDSLYNKFNYSGLIDAVEIDEIVINIAKNQFNVNSFNKLTIIQNDAYKFVKESSKKYDLVIVDLFIDTKVPEQFYQADFCNNLKKSLSNIGEILFNVGIELPDDSIISMLKNNFDKFSCLHLNNVEKTNSLLVISQK